MWGIRLIGILFLAIAVAGPLAQEIYAETRTLTTTVIVTVRPVIPQMQGAPQQATDLLTNALSQSVNERFVKLETPSRGGIETPCYTMMEKL